MMVDGWMDGWVGKMDERERVEEGSAGFWSLGRILLPFASLFYFVCLSVPLSACCWDRIDR